MIKKFNISKPEKYIDKSQQEKTIWHNCGTLTEFWKEDGSVNRVIEIPAISLKANVFEIVPKTAAPGSSPVNDPRSTSQPTNTRQPAQGEELETIQYPAEDIDPNDIPF